MSDSFSAKLTPGWGEDNEISVMRILWNYSHKNGATDAKLYQDLTVLDIFQNMATLNDFWDVMKGKANSEIAKAGTIFQKAGVSPVANSYSWVSTTKAPFFTFQIPRLHVADDVPMSLYSYINLLTFSTITISVFDTDKNGNLNTQLWSVTANVTMSGGNYIITPVNAGEGKFAYLGSSGQYAQFTYTVTQADFNQFRAKPGTGVNVRYFVVSGGSTTTGANSVQTGPYSSARPNLAFARSPATAIPTGRRHRHRHSRQPRARLRPASSPPSPTRIGPGRPTTIRPRSTGGTGQSPQ